MAIDSDMIPALSWYGNPIVGGLRRVGAGAEVLAESVARH